MNSTSQSEHSTPQQKPVYRRWWFWALCALIVLGIANGKKLASPEPPPLRVSIIDLQEAYSTNEVAADAQYGNATLELTGELMGISQGADNRPFLSIKGPTNPLLGVQCVFRPADAQRENLNQLRKGDTITVQGNVFDYVLGNIVLDRCHVVSTDQ